MKRMSGEKRNPNRPLVTNGSIAYFLTRNQLMARESAFK